MTGPIIGDPSEELVLWIQDGRDADPAVPDAPVERNHADRRERRRIVCTGIGRPIPLPSPPQQPAPPQPGNGD
jgi:hypothetical protein